MVREWSEFGSEFRSELELELEGGPADFLMMLVVSESEISSESEIVSFPSEVKRTLAGDLSMEGGLFWGSFSISGVFTGGEFKWAVVFRSYVPHPKSLLPLSKASQDSPLILQVTRFLTDITISCNLQNIFSALLAIINEDSC